MNNIQSIQNFLRRLNIFKATLREVTVDNLPLTVQHLRNL